VFRRRGASRRLSSAAAALATGGLALAALAGAGPAASAGASAACGAATVATIAAADATVTTDIYRNELAGTEVTFDLAQITGAADLLGAVASDNRAGRSDRGVRELEALLAVATHRRLSELRTGAGSASRRTRGRCSG